MSCSFLVARVPETKKYKLHTRFARVYRPSVRTSIIVQDKKTNVIQTAARDSLFRSKGEITVNGLLTSWSNFQGRSSVALTV